MRRTIKSKSKANLKVKLIAKAKANPKTKAVVKAKIKPTAKSQQLLSQQIATERLEQIKKKGELTDREKQIVQLLWEELSAKEIGARLDISPRTVEAHRWNICQKTRAKNSVGIIKYGLRNGIIK
jgi:DNA-binding CsgD family transcriptional regulator